MDALRASNTPMEAGGRVLRAPGIGRTSTGMRGGAIFLTKAGACPLPGLTSPTRQFAENLVPVMREEMSSNPAIDHFVIATFWPFYFSECWKGKSDQYFVNRVALNLPVGQEMAMAANHLRAGFTRRHATFIDALMAP